MDLSFDAFNMFTPVIGKMCGFRKWVFFIEPAIKEISVTYIAISKYHRISERSKMFNIV